MVALRKGHCYSKLKRSYTRKSKFKKKSYIRGSPISKIARFDMGKPEGEFSHRLVLLPKEAVQIRHNALESARQIVNRHLLEDLGMNYFFKVRTYPHHILRENKMLTGAGADRMQTGMQKAFGKPVGVAAQVKKGQIIFSVDVNEDDIDTAKSALERARSRLPGKCHVELQKISS